jgi:hypothetical protein
LHDVHDIDRFDITGDNGGREGSTGNRLPGQGNNVTKNRLIPQALSARASGKSGWWADE